MNNFYVFRQNNSGGDFIGPQYVIVGAVSPEQAEELAVCYGDVYFNGVNKGIDCPCCGDRWWPLYGNDGFENLDDAVSRCQKYAFDPKIGDKILIVEKNEDDVVVSEQPLK